MSPQPSYHLLVRCPACGCRCRMTRRWLDGRRAPTCGCGVLMVQVDAFASARRGA